MLSPRGDVPIWRGFKDMNTSIILFVSKAPEKYFILTYPEIWPTWSTHRLIQANHRHMSKVTGQKMWHPKKKQSTEYLFMAVVRGKTSLCLHQQECLYGWTSLCKWMTAAVSPHMTSQQGRTVSLNERPACSTYTRLCQWQLMEETSTQIRLYSPITEHWKKAGLKSRVKLTSTNMNRVVIFQAL